MFHFFFFVDDRFTHVCVIVARIVDQRKVKIKEKYCILKYKTYEKSGRDIIEKTDKIMSEKDMIQDIQEYVD